MVIWPTCGHESPRLPHNSHVQLHGPVPTPDLIPYSYIMTSGSGWKCIPKSALGPKATALSILTEPPCRSCTAPHTISTHSISNQVKLLPLQLLPRFWPVYWVGWLVPRQPLNLRRPRQSSESVMNPICYVCTHIFEIISNKWVQQFHNGTMHFRLMAFGSHTYLLCTITCHNIVA